MKNRITLLLMIALVISRPLMAGDDSRSAENNPWKTDPELIEKEKLPLSDELYSELLNSGGIKRRFAISRTMIEKRHDEISRIASYLFNSEDEDDHRAVMRLFNEYGMSLETYLPDWHVYMDHFIRRDRPDDILLSFIALAKRWREQKTMPILAELSDHPFARIRRAAFRAMSDMNNDLVIPAILKLSVSNRPLDRMYALEAAHLYTDRRVEPFFKKMLSDPNKSVRIYAISAMTERENGEDNIGHAARMYLKEEDPEVRFEIVRVIRKRKQSRLVYVLRKAVEDESVEVRREALEAIGEFRDVRASDIISRQLQKETDLQIKLLSLKTLLLLGDAGGGQGISGLIEKDPSPYVRWMAILTASYLNEKGALKAISFAVENDPMEKNRLEAAMAAGNLGSTQIAPYLVRVVASLDETYEVKIAALDSLRVLEKVSMVDVMSVPVGSDHERTIREYVRQFR